MSEKDKKFEAIRQLRDKSATELPELFKDIKETKKADRLHPRAA